MSVFFSFFFFLLSSFLLSSSLLAPITVDQAAEGERSPHTTPLLTLSFSLLGKPTGSGHAAFTAPLNPPPPPLLPPLNAHRLPLPLDPSPPTSLLLALPLPIPHAPLPKILYPILTRVRVRPTPRCAMLTSRSTGQRRKPARTRRDLRQRHRRQSRTRCRSLPRWGSGSRVRAPSPTRFVGGDEGSGTGLRDEDGVTARARKKMIGRCERRQRCG